MASVAIAERESTALYRHFDAAGNLLYVGISLNAVARLYQHSIGAKWFRDIARIEVEWHPSRSAAAAAEIAAIRSERPLHNTAHAIGMPPALVALLETNGWGHMVDADGLLLPEFATLTPGQADDLADRL